MHATQTIHAANDDGRSGASGAARSEAWRRAYERKFSDLLFLIRQAREDTVIVHHPQVLGDDYAELVESLDRLADAGKRLAIVPRNERK